MREQAQELRNNAATWVEALEAGELAVMRAGADALEALARVEPAYEEWCIRTANCYTAQSEMLLADISAAIEGEALSHVQCPPRK